MKSVLHCDWLNNFTCSLFVQSILVSDRWEPTKQAHLEIKNNSIVVWTEEDSKDGTAHSVHELQQMQKFHFMNAQKYPYVQGVDVPVSNSKLSFQLWPIQ